MRLSLDCENIHKSASYIYVSLTRMLLTFSAVSKAADIFRGKKKILSTQFYYAFQNGRVLVYSIKKKSIVPGRSRNRVKNKAHKNPYEDEPNKI